MLKGNHINIGMLSLLPLFALIFLGGNILTAEILSSSPLSVTFGNYRFGFVGWLRQGEPLVKQEYSDALMQDGSCWGINSNRTAWFYRQHVVSRTPPNPLPKPGFELSYDNSLRNVIALGALLFILCPLSAVQLLRVWNKHKLPPYQNEA